MNLQELSSRVSECIGREHPIIRTLRPIYIRTLDLATRGRGFQRTVNGAETFYIDPRHRDLFPETWEPQVYDFLRRLVKPGDVCIDVGAHFGIYALSLARWAGEQGHVFAFEPNPHARRVLESNIRRNQLQKRITVIPLGVSDRQTTERFYAAERAAFSRFGEPNPERAEKHQAISVVLTTLDDFCANTNVRPDWVLLDIEGYEVAALRGASQMIEEGRSQLGLIVEMHPFLWEHTGTSRMQFEALLGDLRLAPRALSGQQDLWAENGQVLLEYV